VVADGETARRLLASAGAVGLVLMPQGTP
jgi:hypothetical protein